MKTVGSIIGMIVKGTKLLAVLSNFVTTEILMEVGKNGWSIAENCVVLTAKERPIKNFVAQGFKDYYTDTL